MKQVHRIPKLPERQANTHKGSYGTVGVLAGSEGMLGAAILVARGALRGGAGLVQACLPAPLMAPFTVAVPAATTLPRTDTLVGLFERASTLVIGPGLGQSAASLQQVQTALKRGRASVPQVLDADALNVCAPLREPVASDSPLVITPHPGEAARLLEQATSQIQTQRQDAVQELVRRSGHVAILKGSQTLVCDGDRLFVNQTGNPGLATGGSGDVLSGLLGALLAQGLEPFDAACLAVHVHGRAGDLVAERLSEPGLCAEDLPLAIAKVLAT